MTLPRAWVGRSQGNGPYLVVAGAIFRLRKAVEMTQERGTARAESLSCPRAGSREQDVVALKVSLTTDWAACGQALEEGWLLLFVHQTLAECQLDARQCLELEIE